MQDRENNKQKDLILVVDDQANNLNVISSVLGKDYAISIANNGFNALKILDRVSPALILLDIMMPEMDGYEVCKRIKGNEKTKEIPIIFLTAKTDIEDIVKGFDHGAVDYITKPFNVKEVRVRVKNHLEMYHAKKDLETNQKILRHQYDFQSLLTEIANNFNKAGLKKIDQEVFSALKSIGMFFGVDRCWINLFTSDGRKYSNSHEWFSDNSKSHIQRLQDVECSKSAWLCSEIKNRQIVAFSSLDELPDEAKDAREEFEKTGTSSACLFPLIHDKVRIGFVGMSTNRESRVWEESELKMMSLVVKSLAELFNRQRIEEKLLKAERKSTAMAMVVTANHELRQPIMIVQGNVELLKIKLAQCKDIDYMKYISKIEESLEKMGSILNKMKSIEEVELKSYTEEIEMIKLDD